MTFNIFNRICLFHGHIDYIKHIEKIDQNRFSTGGDDGMIIVIDIKKCRQLHVFKDHKLPITAMHCIIYQERSSDNESLALTIHHLLATSSADRRIIVWDVDMGSKLHVLTGLESVPKCLGSLEQLPMYLILGGEKLVIWDMKGGYTNCIIPSETEYVRFMIFLKDSYAVSAIDDHIVVAEINLGSLHDRPKFNSKIMKLRPHREAITSLIKINDNHFLSGSLDGAISHWSGMTWECIYSYNYVEQYLGVMRVYPYSVQHLKVFEEHFLIAGIGRNITIFNTDSKNCLYMIENAHSGKINHIDVIYNGQFIATCSEDATVKIWRVFSDNISCKSAPLVDILRNPPIKVELLEVCSFHTSSVMKCVSVGENKILSCGNDKQTILWMDGFIEEMTQYGELRDLMPY